MNQAASITETPSTLLAASVTAEDYRRAMDEYFTSTLALTGDEINEMLRFLDIDRTYIEELNGTMDRPNFLPGNTAYERLTHALAYDPGEFRECLRSMAQRHPDHAIRDMRLDISHAEIAEAANFAMNATYAYNDRKTEPLLTPGLKRA